MGIPTGVVVDVLLSFLLCVEFVEHLLSSCLHVLVSEDGHLEDVIKRMAPTLTSPLFLEVGAVQ